MYTPHVVTLINVSQNDDESLFYNVTILDKVFLDLSKRTNINKSGLTDADAATLFIPFSTVGKDGAGREKQYVSPKVYDGLEDKRGYWTLKDGGQSSAVECYFVKGQIPAQIESYEDLTRRYDYVYAVTSVDLRDFGSASMQHFQVGGK